MSFVADLVGGALTASAAGKASGIQAGGAQKAGETIQTGGTNAIGAQTTATGTETANQAPYTSLGAQTGNSLANLLKPGGQLTQGYQSFEAPTGVTESNDPGYQFRLQQGMKALQNSAAARGGLLSGGTAQALSDYGQNSASNEYQNVYNRALQTYGTNFNTFNSNNNNLYNRLFGTTSLGEGATSNLNSDIQQGAVNTGNIYQNTAQGVAQQQNNAAAARASGIMGAANAWSKGISGAADSISGGGSLGPLTFAF